ncbi:MAG TPA: DUF2625 family protein [Candidatus Saccharimonadales bacterium]|nr:DUF2625 family protein [Candidatus Saccharimonadales bacterium]
MNYTLLKDETAKTWDQIVLHVNGLKDTSVLPAIKKNVEKNDEFYLTNDSFLNALFVNCAGILVDSGWLRILGSGNESLPALCKIELHGLEGILVARDILGGAFLLHGQAVSYYAPDTLRWECLDISYPTFLEWALSGKTREFYELFRWTTWQEDVSKLKLFEGFSVYPFLFTKEGKAINSTTRKIVDLREIDLLNDKFSQEI